MPMSPYCHRVRIALAEKQLDCQSVGIDLFKKENKTEQFLRLNPLGKVPVLVDEGLILAESLVINQYLEEEYPYPALMPEDAQSRALVRLWSAQIDAMVFTPGIQILRAEWARDKGESLEEESLEEFRAIIQQFFVHAARALKNQDFLVGAYSLADIAFAPMVFKLEKMKVAVPQELPQVAAWVKRLVTRASVNTTKA
ncbi:MAG: glutathione S-transferase family protein [Deltaproteobacteria bacterium]|nr:glutathione S-transferase family protein [Deltaproteobacteria bacterium]